MEIVTRHDDGIGIIEVSGAIDGSTASTLRDAIHEMAQTHDHMLVDMNAVHFMSSAGLRVMLLLHRQLQQNDGRVVLVGMMEPIYDAMEATGFLKYFETADNLNAARKLLSGE